MERQGFSYKNDSHTNPPPIVGLEVSARWNRNWKGEIIMTIVMPSDVMDTEVYVKSLEDTLESKWIHGCPPPGEELGALPNSLTLKPRKR